MTRRPIVIALVLAFAALAAACGSDGADPAAAPTTTAAPGGDVLAPFDPAQSLPPNDVGALRELYDPILAPLGLRLTRGALIDVSGGGYEPSNDGRHLALYAEPIAPDYSPTQYLDGFWQVSATVTPDVFARWSEIESYDICLEPVDSVDDSDEPFPVTQVNITREAASQIDWQGGELVDLITAGRTDPDVRVVVSRDIRSTPEYQTVLELSRAREPDTTSTTAAAQGNGFG